MNGRKARQRRKNIWAWTQNGLIVLLTLSALYLAARTGVPKELASGTPSGWMARVASFFQGGAPSSPTPVPGDGRPVMAALAARIAVCHDGERFAVQYDPVQVGKLFDTVGGLLGEGLAGAQEPRQIGEDQWRRALQGNGVYFDFLDEVPLSALYTWLGEGNENPNLTGSARHILLAYGQGEKVDLYYQDEGSGDYYLCATALTDTEHMQKSLSGYGDNGARFAFECSEEEGYSALNPYVLLLAAPPAPGEYRAFNPLAEADESQLAQLQADLAFRTQSSNAIYPVPGGMTIREGRETLTVGSGGTVTYHAPERGSSRYTVGEPGQVPTEIQVIEAARRLAWVAESRAGSGNLYLTEAVCREDGTWRLCFGYSLEGARVRLPGDEPAAEFFVRDGQITDYTIRFRSYEPTEEHTLIMGERQAAAAMGALNVKGRELVICYEDTGEMASAGWIAQ